MRNERMLATNSRRRLRAGLAALSAALGIATAARRDWLEVIGIDPDRHSGAAEWTLVVVLLGVAVALGASALRLARATTPGA
ncbi:MAG: hypothetical protein ACJ747_05970 [Gaiellaceae bacterium]|jgi:hypothetical protein